MDIQPSYVSKQPLLKPQPSVASGFYLRYYLNSRSSTTLALSSPFAMGCLQFLQVDLSDLATYNMVCRYMLDSDKVLQVSIQFTNQRQQILEGTQLIFTAGFPVASSLPLLQHSRYYNSTPMIRIHSRLALLTVLIVNLACTYCWTPQAEQDRVQELSGYMNFTGKFEMFSGYLDVQSQPRVSIFYVFLTSMSRPLKDDLVLWLNGGPGCSSLEGLTQQIGPNMLFPGSRNFSASPNPYSWNNQANLLFLETPAGTGYSINDDPAFVHNQSRTAENNIAALKAWYARFPEMAGLRFWITGESYAGMFIPYLASAFIDANQQKLMVPGRQVDFRGVVIGNGVLVTDRRWRKMVRNRFYSRHYYFGPEIDALLANCRYDDADSTNPSCIRGTQLAAQSIRYLNPYATTGICFKQPDSTATTVHLEPDRQYAELMLQGFRAGNFSPCTEDASMENYFNQAMVKAQLHAQPTLSWQDCNLTIGYNYQRDNSSLPLFGKLRAKGLKIMLYSGNTDAVVSHVETDQHVKILGWARTGPRKPVVSERGSLLGWVTQYDGLKLATINGAGHMAPGDKPHAVFTIVREFMKQ